MGGGIEVMMFVSRVYLGDVGDVQGCSRTNHGETIHLMTYNNSNMNKSCPLGHKLLIGVGLVLLVRLR